MSALSALIWIALCSAAGATPNRWHRPIAYALMLAALPVLWALARDHGTPWALAFFGMTLFQFRLLLLHWLRGFLARRKAGRP